MKKVLGTLAVSFLIIMTVSGTCIYFYLNSFSPESKNNSSDQSFTMPKQVKTGEPINVLLLGVDVGIVGSKNSPKRSDTMIVFHYDPKTYEVSMVSVPRDTRVIIKGNPEKINAANAFGGPSMAIESVQDLLNININYYVTIDYEGFTKFVDTIGGIDVVIPYNMDYDAESQNLHIHFKKGQSIHLDGKKAQEFVRWRKNNDGTGYAEGDMGRIKTQQEFLIKIIEKIKSQSIILKIPAIIKMLPQYIKTNIEPIAMLNLSKEIPKININSMQKFTLQGENKTIGGLWYFVYAPSKNADIVSLLGGKVKLADENNKTINKNIRVQILNGSGIAGISLKVKQELEEKGYTVVSTGNISGVKFISTHIVDKTLEANNAKKIASELNIDNNNIKKDQDELSKVDIVVILGLDKNNTIN